MATLSDILPFSTLYSPYFLQNLHRIAVRQPLPHQRATVQAIFSGNRYKSHSETKACLSTLHWTYFCRNGLLKSVLPFLAVLGWKFLLLERVFRRELCLSSFLKISCHIRAEGLVELFEVNVAVEVF